MNRTLLLTSLLFLLIPGAGFAQKSSRKSLSKQILNDFTLDTVQRRALNLLTEFSAGTSYNEIWIRDFNTFIKGSLKVHSPEVVKKMLLMFFQIQGTDGNIVDGLVDTSQAHVGYDYRYSPLLPNWAAHKNTVETDQESSLIQAVRKYIDVTGDRFILQESIDGKKVINRMEDALSYILKDRWSDEYGLVKGATTIDWGDVQPETGWGVNINNKTKWSIDIYDNAMFVIAIHDFLAIQPKDFKSAKDWKVIAKQIKTKVRQHLWSVTAQKYHPHLYLDGSPFSKAFKENDRVYSGGSICAIMADFNSQKEIKNIISQLKKVAEKEKYGTIGITVYPPYPASEFPNMLPYQYQNAGDWTWFGGRIVSALIPYGLEKDALDCLKPMIERTIKHKGFFEWYNVQTGEPKGSGNFRGEAGVLYDAISQLKDWAKQNN
jgi:glycogen debranching enzyme